MFGIKPTYGLVPLFPASPYGTLAHVGPLSWTVADARSPLDVLSGSDSRDWTAGPRAGAADRPRAAIGAGVAGMRIAFSPTLGYADVDPEVARGRARRPRRCSPTLGARVELVDPAFADPVDGVPRAVVLRRRRVDRAR